MKKLLYLLLLSCVPQSYLFAQSDTAKQIQEVVITGTMKAVRRSDAVVPVELISYKFFQKNPTPSLFESISLVNGVQAQINCNVCNTGDIHINGMEGPYTMILIDGMPIVSSLSTIYGLSGIPNSMIDRIEIVRGPASSLYGSEAMGGIINVITKSATAAPKLSVDVMATSWQEYNTDLSGKIDFSKRIKALVGLNYFHYQNPIDNNKDGFTDISIQERISVFNKWDINRKNNREASLALRYVSEDRWGGQMNWTKEWRGTDSVYGEQITTNRWELIAKYQLPFREKIMTQFSFNEHKQNSVYGIIPFIANQRVAFVQSYWDKEFGGAHSFLLGTSVRYIYYDDNTVGTKSPDGNMNMPNNTMLPGVFVQDEWKLNSKSKLLTGYRLDYDQNHGLVHSPRLAYKYTLNEKHTFRASLGTGYRVVNLFTEDHAALTGARKVEILESLKPEKSYNANVNYVLNIPNRNGWLNIDATGFYSYFTNKIVADFDSDPQKIIYKNLKGNAVSRGLTINAERNFTSSLKLTMGITAMDVFTNQENTIGVVEKSKQIQAPNFSGNAIATYTIAKKYTVDFTAKWYGPMRLPIVPNDFRPEYSPLFCLANFQLSYAIKKKMTLYGGVKNIFNFIPKNPILRPADPFNKLASDPIGNPNGYNFDPSYNYASLQGRRLFLGFRYSL